MSIPTAATLFLQKTKLSFVWIDTTAFCSLAFHQFILDPVEMLYFIIVRYNHMSFLPETLK